MNFGHWCALAMVALGGLLSLALSSPWPFIGLGAAAVVVGIVAAGWGKARNTIDWAAHPDAPTQPLEIGTVLHQQMEKYLEDQ